MGQNKTKQHLWLIYILQVRDFNESDSQFLPPFLDTLQAICRDEILFHLIYMEALTLHTQKDI